jgi:hypothetical protein
MISYEVTLQAQPRLATNVEIRFSCASPGGFRTAYQANTQTDLDRYVQDHAPRFRAEFLERFPEGVHITRETWVQREVWR